MNLLPVSLFLLGGFLPSHAQEKTTTEWDVEIPVPISNEKQTLAAPKPNPIDFKVQSSMTTRMEVTEAPEMLGLPPIKGTINVTVQMVENPGLPDPPPSLPALPPDDPTVISRMKELRESYRGTELVFLSATVYDHSRTLLRIYPNGEIKGEIIAWSNVDFNHFSGFSFYRVNESNGTFRDYGLLMGIGNTDTHRMRSRLAEHRNDYEEPKIPLLSNLAIGGPTFVVTKGEIDGEAMDTLSQVHDLYRKEGIKMEDAFYAREKANAARRDYLLANPSVPEDIVIRFWTRDQPSGR